MIQNHRPETDGFILPSVCDLMCRIANTKVRNVVEKLNFHYGNASQNDIKLDCVIKLLFITGRGVGFEKKMDGCSWYLSASLYDIDH